MRYFLIFLFVAISTFCNAQVTISPHAARYALGQMDLVERLQEENRLLTLRATNLEFAVSVLQEEKEDILIEKNIERERVEDAREEIKKRDDENKTLRRQIKREKFQKVVIIVGSVVIIILVAI